MAYHLVMKKENDIVSRKIFNTWYELAVYVEHILSPIIVLDLLTYGFYAFSPDKIVWIEN
jgi:hypothetical protein